MPNFQHLIKFAEKSYNFRIAVSSGRIYSRASDKNNILFFAEGKFVKKIWNHELLVKFMNISCLSLHVSIYEFHQIMNKVHRFVNFWTST